MVASIKYFITDSGGSWIDWSLNISPLTVLGKEAQVVGGSGSDSVFVQAGSSLTATALFSGSNAIYLTGRFSDYAQAAPDGAVYTLTRTGGLATGQAEIIKVLGGGTDKLYFADGFVDLGDVRLKVSNAFVSMSTTVLSASDTAINHPVPVDMPSPVANPSPVKAFVVDSAGADVAPLPQTGQTAVVVGGSGSDTVYVRKGTSVTATALFSGDNKVFLTGNFSDYAQAAPDGAVYTLTRTGGLATGQAEVIKVLGGGTDKLYFADGFVNLSDAGLKVSNAFVAMSTAVFNPSVTDTTPGLSDITPPNAPRLSLGAGVSNGATNAEATQASGVVLVNAENGSTVQVSFSDGVDTVVKTVVGTGANQAVTLAGADLGTGTLLANGVISVTALATDVAGNISTAGATSFVLDTTPPVLTVSLEEDTGRQDVPNTFTDGRSSNPTVNVGGLEPGASWQYHLAFIDSSLSAGDLATVTTWLTEQGFLGWKSGSGASFLLPDFQEAVLGSVTEPNTPMARFYQTGIPLSITVRQTDAAGNVGVSETEVLVYDHVAPITPNFTNAFDSNHIKTLVEIESGEIWKYQISPDNVEPNGFRPVPTPIPDQWIVGTGDTFDIYEMGEGTHWLQIITEDLAGNLSGILSVNYTVAPPVMP